jgi:SAM-dependent methyltransferase
MSPFDDLDFVERFLQKRQSPRSLNNLLDTPMLLELAGDFQSKSVVEIGCNVGSLAEKLTETGLARYIGFDISEAFLARARKRIVDSRFAFEVLDANAGLPECSADLVLSGLTLNFVENAKLLLATTQRALSEGGLFVFSIRHPMRTSNLEGKRSDGSWNVRDYCEEGRRTHHWHGAECTIYHRTVSTWISMLAASGFQILKMKEPLLDPNKSLPDDMDHCLLPGVLFFKCRRI